MKSRHFLTGAAKLGVYLRIILHIPCYYLRRCELFHGPGDYVRFLRRALRLLLVFRHNKIVRTPRGFKLHLYLPAYPSPAFFHALESKLLTSPPGPTTVVFSMTKACAYRCRHCYQKNDPAQDLDTARMIETALAVRDRGVALFNIEGGEPLLRFPRLMSLVRALDERCEIWINTTGGPLQPGMLRELKQAGVFGLMVSIHSPDPEVHDTFTGISGSFDKARAIIVKARKTGLAVTCNSVLSEAELRAKGLARIMNLTRELDCDYVQLIHPKPAGEWLERKEAMQTDPELIRRIQREHLHYNRRKTRDGPSLAAQVFEESRGVLGCTAGAVDRFYVGANGEVQPCEFLNLSFGNVHDESFAVIFERMRNAFRQPGTDWLCCTQASAIQRLMQRHGLRQTPLPWSVTRELIRDWDRGPQTPVYRKLGIYP